MIHSINVEIHFSDSQSAEQAQSFVDSLLENHPIDLYYQWEAIHCGPPTTDQPS